MYKNKIYFKQIKRKTTLVDIDYAVQRIFFVVVEHELNVWKLSKIIFSFFSSLLYYSLVAHVGQLNRQKQLQHNITVQTSRNIIVEY